MFARLIFAHLVGDFVLQTRWLVRQKRTPAGLAIHVGLVGLAMLPVAWDRLGRWWPWLLIILLIHAATDWTKIRLDRHLPLPPILLFLADQAVHVASLAAVTILAEPTGLGVPWSQAEPLWWIASAYLVATFGLSIALPLWLDPPSLMHRPLVTRLSLIAASAVVLTLAWRGLPLLIPVVGLTCYQVLVRRLARTPVTTTFAIEFLSAMVVAAGLGWSLP